MPDRHQLYLKIFPFPFQILLFPFQILLRPFDVFDFSSKGDFLDAEAQTISVVGRDGTPHACRVVVVLLGVLGLGLGGFGDLGRRIGSVRARTKRTTLDGSFCARSNVT